MNSQTKICPQCKSEINARAKKCSQCQSDLRSWFARHPLITMIIATPFIIGILHGIFENSNKPTDQPASTAATATPAVTMVFDVPSLIGKNIDQVRAALGTPDDKDTEPTALQKSMGIKEWDNSFTKNGKTLLVTFSPNTRKVIDFFIDADDPSGTTNDVQPLLQITNVTTNSQNYSVEPVKSLKDPSSFTGIKITPK